MTWTNRFPEPPPPSDEQIKKWILEFAKKRYFIRTFEREQPIFKCALVLPKLGKDVMVELMPSLALRVRDQANGEILVQSMPGDFDTLDLSTPIEKIFDSWQASRRKHPDDAQADEGDEGASSE